MGEFVCVSISAPLGITKNNYCQKSHEISVAIKSWQISHEISVAVKSWQIYRFTGEMKMTLLFIFYNIYNNAHIIHIFTIFTIHLVLVY